MKPYVDRDQVKTELHNAIWRAAGRLSPCDGAELVIEECQAFLLAVQALIETTRRTRAA